MSKQRSDDQYNSNLYETRRGPRPIVIIFFIVLVTVASLFTFGLYQLYTTTNEAIENSPIFNPVRSLLVKSTPEILPDPRTIVIKVNQLARLETAQLEAEQIVTSERDTDVLFGLFGESIVFVAVGEVIAGIDFAKLEDGDIQVVDPDTVMIHLPKSEILVSALDNDKSYVVDRDTGLFSGADPQLETQVRQIGEAAILEYALEEVGIIEIADENAKQYMEGFLNELGFENVEFTDEKPPVPEPYVQEVPKGHILVTVTPSPNE